MTDLLNLSPGAGVLFVKDQPPRPIKGGDLAAELITEIRRMVEGR